MASAPALTPGEREAAGKAARARTPRKGHGGWEPAPDRADPVEILQRQDETRVPELVPIRHGRMLASPFSFYRGAAAVMASDLGTGPNTGLEVQLCGDAHLSNFGAFMAPDRRLIFDINDFDETHPGPFEWDVKRLAASVAVAGRGLGLKRAQRDAATRAAAATYRQEIRRLAALPHLEVWYSRVDLGTLERYLARISARRTERLKTNAARAERKNSLRALGKLTVSDGDGLRIVSQPPLIVPIEELPAVKDAKLEREQVEAMLRELIDRYRSTLGRDVHELARRYEYVHAAHKVVGVGSVGAQAWIVLTLGRDRGDPLFLQVKEAQRSVLEPYTRPSRFKNQGRRVVEGQRLMQAASDVFLGWLSAQGLDGRHRDYYVRQLWDGKGSAVIETMDAEGLRLYAALCGGTLARAHARSGDRIAIAAYLGKGDTFERAMGEFAEAYAHQNERDYEAFAGAVESGRLEAQRDI